MNYFNLIVFYVFFYVHAVFADVAGSITIIEPYARAMPPGQPNSAVFMQLKNTGKTDHFVIDADSPVANTVELHTHQLENGIMKMRRIPQISLPEGETVELKPGGLHIMLIGLQQILKPGNTIEVTLLFEDRSAMLVTIPVRRIGIPYRNGHVHQHHQH
jgi:hypothetical protein